MRRSNWKLKVLIVVAMALGFTAAILAAILWKCVCACKGDGICCGVIWSCHVGHIYRSESFKIGRD